MHYVVNDAVNGHFAGTAHTFDGITVLMLRIGVWCTKAVAPNVAAEKLLLCSFISDDDTVSEGFGDSRPGDFNAVPIEFSGVGRGRCKSATHVG
jgi:hypothetical protein